MSDSKSRDMGVRIKIEEHPRSDEAYCTSCYARNYDIEVGPTIGKRVTRLYDIYFNMIAPSKVTLCGECVADLYGALDQLFHKPAKVKP